MALTHEDIVAVWGRSNIVRLTNEDFDILGLPEEARPALVDIGLPVKTDLLFSREDPEWVQASGSRYCKIGSDYGTELCVNPDSGQVLSLSRSGRYPSRFVNSRPEFFVEFLGKVVAERRRCYGFSDAEIGTLVEQLEAELRKKDPDAFAGPDHWWSVIFEQMRDGLL